MLLAFVLVETLSGAEAGVLRSLSRIKGVKEAYVVYGEFDIIARVEVSNVDELRDLVLKRIRGLKNVKGTRTAIVAMSPIKYPSAEKLG